MEWALFTLAFILGYVTCKLLYFRNSARAGMVLIRASQLISIGLLAKSLEDFYFAKIYRMEKMVESEETPHNITAFSYLMEEEVEYYKKRSIQALIDLHPEVFKQLVEFEDWPSAMKFLDKNQRLVESFLTRTHHD